MRLPVYGLALAFRVLALILSAALSSLVQNGTRPHWKRLMDWMLSLAITDGEGQRIPNSDIWVRRDPAARTSPETFSLGSPRSWLVRCGSTIG